MPPIDNPLLFDFPDHFETARLLLRVPRPGDGAIINAAVRESSADLKPWMVWAQTEQTVEESEAVVRRAAAKFIERVGMMLLLLRKSDGVFVGASGLHHMDWSVPQFEIGYWVRTSLQGQGYITEAVNGITTFAFAQLQAERVEIRCDSRNQRSAAVAERAGYTREGYFRHDSRDTAGALRDTLIYAKIRGE